MLVLDFINVGNGDSILVREMEGERLRFSMLVDCGHDSLERDDHPPVEDPRSCRIFAGDFLRSQGVAHLISCWSPTSTGTTSVVWAGCWRPSLWASC